MSGLNREIDFLQLHPKWNCDWEKSDNGLTVILIPKFGDHAIGKWLMAHMARPNYRMKLDEIGSFVWEHCDGNDSVQEIGRKLSKHFGEKVEPVYERLTLFFQSLQRSKSITWSNGIRENG